MHIFNNNVLISYTVSCSLTYVLFYCVKSTGSTSCVEKESSNCDDPLPHITFLAYMYTCMYMNNYRTCTEIYKCIIIIINITKIVIISYIYTCTEPIKLVIYIYVHVYRMYVLVDNSIHVV